jgi:hypothetical protein
VLRKYDLAPRRAVAACAFGITLLESCIGVSLFLPRLVPLSAYAALCVLMLFTIAMSVSMARGKLNIECGCNGFWKKTRIGWYLIVRNLGISGLAFLASERGMAKSEEFSPWIFLLCVALIVVPQATVRSQSMPPSVLHASPNKTA